MDEYDNGRPAAGTEIGPSGFAGEIRATTFGLLIAGGLCLYFGFTLLADAPGNASEAEAQRWYALDHALFWSLRIVGVLFLAAAGLAATGRRAALAAGAVCDALFALLMLAMAVAWTAEARAAGGWDPTVILLVLLAIISVAHARRSWSLYRMSAPEPAGPYGPLPPRS